VIKNARTTPEGDSGTTLLSFDLSYDWPGAEGMSFDYATADGSANAPGDYSAISGTVRFSAGRWPGSISIQVKPDTTVEPDETVLLNLSNPSGVRIVDGEGVGTISNDDERLVLRAPIDRTQLLDRALELRIGCSEVCTTFGSGSLLIARSTTAGNANVSAARRSWRLRRARKRVAAGKTATLRLRVPRAARRAGLKALRGRRKVSAAITVKATANGRSTKKRVRIRLSAPRR
jgi:hypothetical protein